MGARDKTKMGRRRQAKEKQVVKSVYRMDCGSTNGTRSEGLTSIVRTYLEAACIPIDFLEAGCQIDGPRARTKTSDVMSIRRMDKENGW